MATKSYHTVVWSSYRDYRKTLCNFCLPEIAIQAIGKRVKWKIASDNNESSHLSMGKVTSITLVNSGWQSCKGFFYNPFVATQQWNVVAFFVCEQTNKPVIFAYRFWNPCYSNWKLLIATAFWNLKSYPIFC